jgi:hypothetical protein
MTITTSELHQCLYGAKYPASKRYIIEFAKERRASPTLLNELKELPEGVYFGVIDIQEEILENTWTEEDEHLKAVGRRY